MKQVKTIFPDGGLSPKFAPEVGTTGSVPCGVIVIVGNGDGVSKDNVGANCGDDITEPGVAVERPAIPNGVVVGRGCGGFRNV